MNRACYLRCFAIIWMLLLLELGAQGQLKLGSNPAVINKSSVLELESQVQGLLLPRIPDTAAVTLSTAPNGMIIFFTPDNSLMVRKNGFWRRVADTANFSGLLATSGWALGGNAVPGIRNFGTTTNFDLPVITNNLERLRITNAGNVGIGVTTPSTKLHVQGANPLTLMGVQNGTSTNADSLLTITSGLVRKIPILSFNGWALGGNAVLSAQNFGTTSNFDLPVITNNVERLRVTNAGNVGIGITTPATLLHVQGANPLTLTGVQNGTSTTADSLLTITSGLVRKVPFNSWSFGGNAVASAQNFGTTSNFDLPVITNNLERLRITNTGNVGIGVNTPSTKLHVQGANPLTLTGVQNGTSTTADSLLTITSGLVRKIPIISFNGWALGGNAVAGVQNFGTTTNFDLPVLTNNLERLRITNAGNVGIGVTTPSTLLHVQGTNPLTLTGVQNGTSTTADSLLTITSGLVRKLPMATFATTAATWGTSGNSGLSSLNFLGTTDNVSMRFRTNNVERMYIDSARGLVGIGTNAFDVTNPEKLLIDAGTTTSVNALYLKGSINNYFQVNIRNLGTGTQSSSDFVATANNGTETTNFMNMGINGSGYVYQTGNPIETGKANDTYILGAGNDLYMVNNNATKDIIFLAGGTAATNEAMRITATERVGIGTTLPSTFLHIKTGTTGDGGLRLENLTNTSATTLSAGYLGVDATGKVVRANTQPAIFSGSPGGTATVDAVTKVWIADVAYSPSGGTQVITFPVNIGFATILNIQLTARGGAGIADTPIPSVVSNTLTSMTIRVMESATTVVAGEGLTVHVSNGANPTRIFIRVEGN